MDIKQYYSINDNDELIELIIPADGRQVFLNATIDFILPQLYNHPRKPSEEEFQNLEPVHIVLFVEKDNDLGIEDRFQFFDMKNETSFYKTIPEIIAIDRKQKLKNIL